ncbi:unnamed protein product, partial [marine sediment metagenome]
AELLDGEMRSAADIARKYKEKHKKNIPAKIALLNLLELHAWASEGKIMINSRVRFSPTTAGYVFWKEEKK